MLVLSRKLMEQIQIGENITVTVVHVKGKVVKLGIDAPRDIRIMRTELLSDGKEASAPDASIAHAEPTEDETSGEDEAGVTKGCHVPERVLCDKGVLVRERAYFPCETMGPFFSG